MNRFCLLIFLSCIVCGLFAPEPVSAQDKKEKKRSFDIENFLKRLDANQNGKVEPGEIKDERTKSFLKKAGADPSKPITIKSFSKKISKKRKERDNPKAAQRSTGFAVTDEERTESMGDTPGFAVSDEEREPAKDARNRKFSDGAKKMLDWVLNNYDKNKDGKIDAQEIKAGRWADPPAHVSDTNKDGSLSRMELLVRYQAREDSKNKSDRGKGKSRDDRRSSFRERSRSSSSNSSSRSSSRKSTESRSGSERSGRDVRKGYESYVNGLFKNYDKNNDGVLDKDEIEEMRRKPDMKADADGDKKISKNELIDSYLEKAGHKTGKKSASRSSASSSRSKSNSRSKPSSSVASGSPGSRAPLTSKDKNKNGQIEMSEYESNWTTKKIEEFHKKDKNNDLVITREEWDS